MMAEEDAKDGQLSLCLALLCGIPGAGKTSLAESLQKTCHHHVGFSPDASSSVDTSSLIKGSVRPVIILHLCYDNIIPRNLQMETRGDASSKQSPWKAYRREIVSCVDCILQRFKSNNRIYTNILDHGTNDHQIRREVQGKMQLWLNDQLQFVVPTQETSVFKATTVVLIIDDNMYYRSMRYEYYQLARKHSAGFCQIYLKCSTEVAVARNVERCHDVTVETIRRMGDNIEPPDPQIALWERHSLCIDVTEQKSTHTVSSAWDLVCKALMNSESPIELENAEEKEACRAVCAASVVHQADQALRKCVAKAMAAAKNEGLLTKTDLKELGSKLNVIRQDILQQVRDCKVHLPLPVAMDTGSRTSQKQNDFEAVIKELFEKQHIS